MKILVTGDFCPQHRVAGLFEEGDFNSVLGEIRPIISDAAFSITNFECPITKGHERSIQKQGPNLQCSIKGMEAVKWAGFDAVALANNHFLDYGAEGVENTLNACEKLNLDVVGGGTNITDASAILYKSIDGKRLAVINCCEHEFSIATEASAGSNPLNPIQQYYAIGEARNNADYVLVIVHGGHEHFQLPSPRMQETYRFFIDAGADAVVNHHQHCYSGFEYYKGKPIFYGLGNFCFDRGCAKPSLWYEGYMVELEFVDSQMSHRIYPYRQCAEDPRVEMLPEEAFDARIAELNAIISDKTELQATIDKYYDDCRNNIRLAFEPIRNKYVLAAQRRGWLPSLLTRNQRLKLQNYILCEAHRDKVSRFFSTSY